MEYSLYLAHHGRQGQRWGVRHGPPYPLRPGAFNGGAVSKKKIKAASSVAKTSSVGSGSGRSEAQMKEIISKSKSFIGNTLKKLDDWGNKVNYKMWDAADAYRKKVAQKKAEKETRLAEEERLAQERKEAAKREEHEMFLKTANTKELLERQHEYTTEELQDAINRIKKKNQLMGLDSSTQSTGKKFIEGLGTLNNYTTTGIDAYNNIALLYNTFSSKDSTKMKMINKNFGQKNDNQNKQNNIGSDISQMVQEWKNKKSQEKQAAKKKQDKRDDELDALLREWEEAKKKQNKKTHKHDK